MHIRMSIADCVIEIRAAPYFLRILAKLYPEFITSAEPDSVLQLSDDDVRRIVQKRYSTDPPFKAYDISIDESYINRVIANQLLEFNTILIHGAAYACGDSAIVFTAPSGTGKTTHLKKWVANCQKGLIINGDKPFIKVRDGELPPLVCGSPWAGKESLYSVAMVPLRDVVLMSRGEDNSIKRISKSEAMPFLLQQVYYPVKGVMQRKTIRLLDNVMCHARIWYFVFNNYKDDCFDTAYAALKNC